MHSFTVFILRLGSVAIAALAALAGSAALLRAQSAPDTDDAVVSMRVKAALIASDATKASQINVHTRDGVVQLSGFVESEAMRAAAASTTTRIDGVKDVQNRLMIRSADRSAAQAMDDTVIAAKVKGELAGKTGLGTAARVNVEVNSGVVELSGFVATLDEKATAAEIARTVSGVRDVQNNISLQPQR